MPVTERLGLTTWALVAGLLACQPQVLKYPTRQVEQAAQSFADAFNRDERGQLALMVHPKRREVFEAHRADLDAQLKSYQIKSWALTGPVVVQDTLQGRAVRVVFTDGAVVRENEAVFVLDGDQWWLWKY